MNGVWIAEGFPENAGAAESPSGRSTARQSSGRMQVPRSARKRRRKRRLAAADRPRRRAASAAPARAKRLRRVRSARRLPKAAFRTHRRETGTGPSAGSAETVRREETLASARYEGGEAVFERLLPPDTLLPDVSLTDVIGAGLAAYRPRMLPLLGAAAVYGRMEAALSVKAPLSVVRLGDGELLTLAQDCVIAGGTVAAIAPFLPYAGVQAPDPAARDRLADAVRRADIIGVPVSRKPHFQPLLFEVMRVHGVDLRSKQLTVSTINFRLYDEGYLAGLMRGRRLLVAGNAAPGMAAALQAGGYDVAGVVSPVAGMADIDRVMGEIARTEFDFALVAAGVPAVVLSVRVAAELGRTAIDFGHMANDIADGRAPVM